MNRKTDRLTETQVGEDRYLVCDTDAGIVPVGADVTDGTHDEVVFTVTHLLPTSKMIISLL